MEDNSMNYVSKVEFYTSQMVVFVFINSAIIVRNSPKAATTITFMCVALMFFYLYRLKSSGKRNK